MDIVMAVSADLTSLQVGNTEVERAEQCRTAALYPCPEVVAAGCIHCPMWSTVYDPQFGHQRLLEGKEMPEHLVHAWLPPKDGAQVFPRVAPLPSHAHHSHRCTKCTQGFENCLGQHLVGQT
jgi:hypothetical protein